MPIYHLVVFTCVLIENRDEFRFGKVEAKNFSLLCHQFRDTILQYDLCMNESVLIARFLPIILCLLIFVFNMLSFEQILPLLSLYIFTLQMIRGLEYMRMNSRDECWASTWNFVQESSDQKLTNIPLISILELNWSYNYLQLMIYLDSSNWLLDFFLPSKLWAWYMDLIS